MIFDKMDGLKKELYPFQKIAVEFINNCDGRLILGSEMGTGKAQPLYSKVLTKNGWKKIGDLKIGEQILHPSGKKQKIINIFPQGIKRTYKVTFSDNSSTICCGNHLWSVSTPNRKFRHSNNIILSTEELINKGLRLKNGNNKWYISLVSPNIYKSNKRLLIDPYILGVLLGDGGLTTNTPRLSSADIYIINKVKKEVKKYGLTLKKINKYDYRITGKRGRLRKPNALIADLKKLCLHGKSSLEKFIPEQYLLTNRKNREELLAGLLDTDGYIGEKEHTIEYSSSSKKLANDMLSLVRSLGGVATVKERPTYSALSYRMSISLPKSIEPFRLPRKKNKYLKPVKYSPTRAILLIEEFGDEQCVCIQTESIDGLYITDNYIVTHNTIVSLAYIVLKKYKKILVITPASMKWNWYEEILSWTHLKPIVISSTSNFTVDDYNQHDMVIINYDILKKFQNILSSLQFDICLCDEGHMLKGNSQRFKATRFIVKKIPKLIIITGTFILNRSVDAFNLLNLVDHKTWNSWWNYTKKFCNGHYDDWGYNISGNSNTEELKQLISRYYFRQTKEEVLSQLPEKNFINLPVDLPVESQKKYNFALNSFIEYLKKIKNKTDKEIEKTIQAEKLVRLGELRQICSEGKINIAEELIKNIIDSGQKILIFSCYNHPLEYLHEKFKNISVILTGKTSELDKQQAVNDFQNKDDVKIFFGGILSSSLGLNLTAASNVLFLDFPWRPSDISQAYSRIDRIGQQAKHINIYTLIARGTIDQKIQSLLQKKQKIIDILVENKNFIVKKEINIISDILNIIEKNNI